MKIRTLMIALLGTLMMGGAAYAMDSDAIKAHMQQISQQAEEATASKSRVEALEQQVEELEALIRMMLEEEEAS